MIARIQALCAATLCVSAVNTQAQTLPIYLEESHAGTFYELAATLPLEEEHTLLLIDAHSDATAIPGSDRLRRELRGFHSAEERAERFAQWRESGRVQCFNWIESLMPRPISRVLWLPHLPGEDHPPAEMEALQAKARNAIDGFEEGEPRDAGPLAMRYTVTDWRELSKLCENDKRIVASIDLDSFAALPSERLAHALDDVLHRVLSLRGLCVLTFSISSPYLKNEDQADALVTAALDGASRIVQGRIHLEPFAQTGPDRSLMATMLQRKGLRVPSYDWSKAGTALRCWCVQNWTPAMTQIETAHMETLVRSWAADAFLPTITVQGAQREVDGTWRAAAGDPLRFEIKPPSVGATVQWCELQAETTTYRISDADFGFASNAPKWIFQHRVNLGNNAPATLSQGTHRICAEVWCDGSLRRAAPLTLCLHAPGTTGWKAALSEQWRLPYVFDSRLLRSIHGSGPQARHGADCANFLMQAFAADGWRMQWGSAEMLRKQLQPGWPADGSMPVVIIGAHSAAVWEDKPPLGALNDSDVLAHQLERGAELITFGELKKKHAQPPAVHHIATPAQSVTLAFVGDVMLGRSVGEAIRAGHDPLAGLQKATAGADLVIGNLECVLSDHAKPATQHDQPFHLVGPARGAELLKRAGFHAVSVMNNHAHDLGNAGLSDTLAALENSGVKAVRDRLLTVQIKGLRVGLIATWMTEENARDETITAALQAARSTHDLLIVLPHWGREHVMEPDLWQRQLAVQWLLQGHADFIVGSGPHVAQAIEDRVAWSLGNALFDGSPPDAEWTRGIVLKLTWDTQSHALRRVQHDWLDAGWKEIAPSPKQPGTARQP